MPGGFRGHCCFTVLNELAVNLAHVRFAFLSQLLPSLGLEPLVAPNKAHTSDRQVRSAVRGFAVSQVAPLAFS